MMAMRKIYLFVMSLCLVGADSLGQSVGIDTNSPRASARLDITSTN